MVVETIPPEGGVIDGVGVSCGVGDISGVVPGLGDEIGSEVPFAPILD
jgi:hypothetical protein